MKIDILCDSEKTSEELFKRAQIAVAEAGVLADIHRIDDSEKIMELGITQPPALLIDGKVQFYNIVPSVEKIVGAIKSQSL